MSNALQNIQGYTQQFRSALWLDRLFSYESLFLTAWTSPVITILGISMWLFGQYLYLPAVTAQIGLLVGGVSAAVFVVALGMFGFYTYYRLTTAENVEKNSRLRLTFPVAAVLAATISSESVWTGLQATQFGRSLLIRSGGVSTTFSASDKPDVDTFGFLRSLKTDCDDEVITFRSLAETLLADNTFRSWLFARGITKRQFRQAAGWVTRSNRRWCEKKRFWSPDRLAKITRISQDLAYGQTPLLDRFTTSYISQVFVGQSADNVFNQETTKICNTLSRPRDANVLLVGSEASGTNDVIQIIADKVASGDVPSKLADYHVKILDVEQVVTTAESRQEFVGLIQNVFTEAANAGNVLLVINNVGQLLAVGTRYDVDVFNLLKPYFSHQALPIIAVATPQDYHQDLADTPIAQWTDTVSLHDVGDQALLRLLEDTADSFAGETVCTVGALDAVARSGREVITDDTMPHAAVDLLLEVLSAADRSVITEDYINEYVREKTGIPIGRVDDDEREKLTHLEDTLHERIVGQDHALSAVSEALRRNRAGMKQAHKPIGTFLFLGPTGVGKTETAKAVAETYFNQQSVAARLDMSEFTNPDAVSRLIGDATSVGRLTECVRSNPYGVLLLDEFEKAHSQVHDLFLQILDEGRFSDNRGRSVRLHNMVIIATSNAGADTIFAMMSSGDDPAEHRQAIISTLVESGIYRPELINRFDATVVFRPLSRKQLAQITEKFLDNLATNVKKRRGVLLDIGNAVPAYVADHGFDRQFGARAIERFVQNTVENIVADKIIRNQAEKGDAVTLTTDDIDSRTDA